MPRKKSICSVNAILQVDGRLHYTFRKNGVEVAVKDFDIAHARKFSRLLKGMAGYIDKRFNDVEENKGGEYAKG